MVKKLFKHEIYAYLRTILPMHMILLGIAILGRFIQLFENDSVSYRIVFWSSVVAFIISVVVCIVLTLVFGIRRFYSNLFTSEGYLSFTLPVTSTQHIWVKNTVALLAQLASIIMILISCCAITFGDVCVEVFKAIGYLFKLSYTEIGYHTTLFVIEFIITLVVSIATTYMLFYACIALGQRAKKNRVAAAVGVFFIYYLIMQVISTIFIIIVAVFHEQLYIDELITYLENHPIFTNHLVFSVTTIINAIGFVIFYAITKSSIKNKLNLE